MKEIKKEEFQKEVLEESVPVLVDFWASWCAPCKKVGAILEELESKLTGKAKLVKINIEESPNLASQYMVMSIPALILFKDGRPQEKIVGLVSEREILRMIERNSI